MVLCKDIKLDLLPKVIIKKKESIMKILFEPVGKLEAIRMHIAFASFVNIKCFQMHVKCAFLNVNLNEQVYVDQFNSHL